MSARGEAPLRVLFVTPECAPMTKVGGLGDVSAALPPALRARGIEVWQLIPGYAPLLDTFAAAKERARLRILGQNCRLVEADSCLMLDCPALYVRDGGPYQDRDGRDWEDNALRFGVLSKAAALLAGAASPLGWRPQVLHCHDWPAALAPVYLAGERGVASALTIHNLAFQGNFDAALHERLALPPGSFHMEGLEFYGKLSFLKGGLVFADALTTVSPTYAREIQTQEYGCGLEGLLRRRGGALEGILNGIDTAVWDPGNDPHTAQRYDAKSLDAKAVNKAALQAHLGLAVDPSVPLFGIVARLTQQKGIDLVAAACDALAAAPAQVAVLGQGEPEIERALIAAAERHRGRIAVRVGYDEALAHAIEAGADMFLMPSRFEPCGLNQMYSQRYGTPPVVRATGGLADTVVDGETGFVFERADEAALLEAVRRALAAYRDAARWRQIQRAGMARDFSWGAAARQYADLYRRLATRASPPQFPLRPGHAAG
jgi:starch synthase